MINSHSFQLDLDLENLGADFYTGNLHKWCFAPRGAAFLWIAPKHRENIEPLVTSHLYKQDLTDQFFMQGSMDQSCYLSCSAALDFYKRIGGRRALVDHAKPLLDWAQQMLCHALGTPVLPIPPNMQVNQTSVAVLLYIIYTPVMPLSNIHALNVVTLYITVLNL